MHWKAVPKKLPRKYLKEIKVITKKVQLGATEDVWRHSEVYLTGFPGEETWNDGLAIFKDIMAADFP